MQNVYDDGCISFISFGKEMSSFASFYCNLNVKYVSINNGFFLNCGFLISGKTMCLLTLLSIFNIVRGLLRNNVCNCTRI